MDIREAYQTLGCNYDEVFSRFGTEGLVKRFALKFLSDQSFNELKSALESKDVEVAFRSAHTLKGICLNLGFDSLYEVSSALTEKLRGREIDGYEPYFKAVQDKYDEYVRVIEQVEK